jgi:N utilization substance protein B
MFQTQLFQGNMSLPAQKFREIVFQILYSHDMGKSDDATIVDLLAQELEVSKKSVREAQQRVQDLLQHLEEIDALIGKTSVSYAFERIQSVERNILRVGAYEILFDKDIPPKVAIAEAMRLTRKFSTKEAASFVNAILDSIYRSSEGKPADAAELQRTAEEMKEIERISNEASQAKKTEPDA